MKKGLHIFLLLLLFFGNLSAQEEPEFVSTSGHNLNIRQLLFSPDGKYLATLGDDRMLKVWDMSMKMEYRNLFVPGPEIKEIGFSPDSKRLAAYGLLEMVMVWDLETGELVQQERTKGTQHFVRFRWENGRAIPISLREIFPFLPLTALVVERSRDGKFIASGESDGMLRIWETETGKEILSIQSGFPYFSGLTFSKEGNRVAASSISSDVVRVFDTRTGQLIKELNDWKTNPDNELLLAAGFTDVALSQDGKTLAVAYFVSERHPNQMSAEMQYLVKLFDMESYRSLGALKGRCHLVTDLGVCSKKNLVLTGGMSFPQGVKVWNMENGEVERVHRGMPMMAVSHEGDKAALFEYTKEGIELRIYRIPEFDLFYRKVYRVDAPNSVFFSEDGRKIGMIEPSPPSKTGLRDYYLSVTELESDSVLFRRRVDVRSLAGHQFFTKDDKHIITAHDSTQVYDALTGELRASYEMEYHVGYQWCLGPDGKTLVVESREDEQRQTVYFLDIMTGASQKEIQFENNGLVSCLALSPSGRYLGIGLSFFDALHYLNQFPVVVWDLEQNKEFFRFEGHGNFIRQIAFRHDDQYLYTIDLNGTLSSWNMETQEKEASFLAYNDLDYLILRPDNYYKASGTGLLGIGFRYQGKLYNFEQFDLIYNRPDLVMESLGANPFKVKMYELAYKKRLRKAGGMTLSDYATSSFPSVSVPDKHKIPISTDRPTFSFPVEAGDPEGSLQRLHVHVNDVPIYGPEGLDISEAGGEWKENVALDLARGSNLIQVVAQNAAGLKSPVETFEVSCKSPFEKPDLYVMSIGVSDFETAGRNLKYAAKDAGDIAEALSKSPVFEEVHTRLVVDSQATKEGILEAGRFFAGSKTDDLAVIFISSHGLLDDQLDYFLATHDTDFSNPRAKGLPYENLERLLGSIPARNRLILIDACHSGELDREEVDLVVQGGDDRVSASVKSGPVRVKPKAGLENSFDYMRALFADLSKGTGATIISAAGGMEFALESGDWANGVFTYALIEGLQMGKADQDGNEKILVSELREYVGKRVRELTQGAQNPTSRRLNLRNDFRIY